MLKVFFAVGVCLCVPFLPLFGQERVVPEFSTAGFFAVEGAPRTVQSMNVAWRFHKGDVADAGARDFNDRGWSAVSVPHGIEYVPCEGSGCSNYQGIVWYRKHFMPDEKLKNQKIFLHFEAVMGKAKVYVNGKLLKEHFGGYLPFSIDISSVVEFGKDNVIAVQADNRNDPDYPPGKPQQDLDYTYMGGIYRDVYLIAHENVYITESTYANTVGGGGVFVWYDHISDTQATVFVKVQIRNEGQNTLDGRLEGELKIPGNTVPVQTASVPLSISAGTSKELSFQWVIDSPRLWSPEHPNLYNLFVSLSDTQNQLKDKLRKRIGIRSIEFKQKGGFRLNGKPYGRPIIGGNRHQDFAVIGHALPNSLHYRDAQKMREIGMKVVRNAHCPQDPAFMDACDELGLFVINNTPGWQFWNNKPIFSERINSDIRQLVRRDRDRACVWFWEPVLNETAYPAEQAEAWLNAVLEEYPYPYCYAASDYNARGAEHFPIHFPHPVGASDLHKLRKTDPSRTYFTREFGDFVDNWDSHNSPSRVRMSWGEVPQMVQARHYANPEYEATCLNSLFSMDTEYIGGSLWHTFDHQRGYHPDPFYGGVMDVFRQPKYSAKMFASQQRPEESEPMVFIAHEMTPFSPADVPVFSNCDEIVLTASYGGNDVRKETFKRDSSLCGIPYPIITFKNMFSFLRDKHSSSQQNVHLKAEGYINGIRVAAHVVKPARRPVKLNLHLDHNGIPMSADGSDIVTVVATITDGNGNIKRLNDEYVHFTLEGEGRLIGGPDTMTNPRKLEWGLAPVLVQSTTKPGKIKITVSLLHPGVQKATPATLEFSTVPSALPLCFDSETASCLDSSKVLK